MREAMFYETSEEGKVVKCDLCGHRCPHIADGKSGICGVRVNKDGKLYTLVYGRIVSAAVDPIEKKPLFNFLPRSLAYSIATVGCNFRCGNCQNFGISQMPRERNRIIGEEVTPREVVARAKRHECDSIAYTYTEPTIFFEYAYDTARLATKEGIKNVFVTNGYITEEALMTIRPYLDAANIDLKAFSDGFYRRICGARLDPVLDSIKLHKRLGIWIEVTTLIIPTLNDHEDELRGIAQFIKNVGAEIPWHVTRFYPTYRLADIPRTPTSTLRKARGIGLEEGLRYVYTGNVPGEEGENTYCYECGELLIRRLGYQILEIKIKDSRCYRCGARIDGIWT